MRAVLLLSLLATPALAEVPLSAPDFETHVSGHTLTYTQFGRVYGVEEYLPGRKVRWSVAPDECQYGTWYPEGDFICFVYEYDPNPSCWTFWLREGRLVALSIADAPGAELTEAERSQTPLPCPGPDVGV
ncbi:hypothetical protein [Tabrizicola aquatica]|uniref:hypothetical protein n=1 Tax=Tabrizicola aquatica TaxID=909926 RepID=UPI000CD2D858|nr:hypothetical protein [Tabrizicola aquatica]